MIYANNAGTSWPKPPEVREAVRAALDADPLDHPRLLDSAIAGIARFLGIRDPGGLILTPGCTSALSVALEDLPWEPGDVILTSALEHHAMIRPVEGLVSRRGVIHRNLPYRPGEPADPEAARKVMKEGKVRLLAVTAASNVTGEILPVGELAAVAHEAGALCLVDAAQTAGVIRVDVTALGADMLVVAGHKGPLGPQGIGCLWAGPDVPFETRAAACDITSKERSPVRRPDYCDVGSANIAGASGLAAGMRWHEKREAANLGRSARGLARRLVSRLTDHPGVTLFGSPDAERTATVSLRIEGLPIEKAETHFREHGVVVRAGLHCAPMALGAVGAPGGTIRISFGPFNGEDDLDPILAAIGACRR